MYEGKKEDENTDRSEEPVEVDDDPMLYHHLRLEIVKA